MANRIESSNVLARLYIFKRIERGSIAARS
jgi:hypothetical protein